jgi:hypothetical protein
MRWRALSIENPICNKSVFFLLHTSLGIFLVIFSTLADLDIIFMTPYSLAVKWNNAMCNKSPRWIYFSLLLRHILNSSRSRPDLRIFSWRLIDSGHGEECDVQQKPLLVSSFHFSRVIFYGVQILFKNLFMTHYSLAVMEKNAKCN